MPDLTLPTTFAEQDVGTGYQLRAEQIIDVVPRKYVDPATGQTVYTTPYALPTSEKTLYSELVYEYDANGDIVRTVMFDTAFDYVLNGNHNSGYTDKHYWIGEEDSISRVAQVFFRIGRPTWFDVFGKRSG